MDVISSADLATAILPFATHAVLNDEGMENMKKMLMVLGLVMLSMNAMANDSSVQMVLDNVHSRGFSGCDKEIRSLLSKDEVSHAEAKFPFGKKTKNDEVVIIYGRSGNAEYDWDSSIVSTTFRMVGTECVRGADLGILSSINRGCNQVANVKSENFAVVSKTDESSWVRTSHSDPAWDNEFARQGSITVYTPLKGGGCRAIDLPSSRN